MHGYLNVKYGAVVTLTRIRVEQQMERGAPPGWGKFSSIHWGQTFWARWPKVAPPPLIIKECLNT